MIDMLRAGSAEAALEELHHRSEVRLITLIWLVSEMQDGTPFPVDVPPQVVDAVAAVVDELGRAQRLVADQSHGRSERFLAVRFARLKVAADAVVSAAETDDLPGLRRSVLTFQSLAGALGPIHRDAQKRATPNHQN